MIITHGGLLIVETPGLLFRLGNTWMSLTYDHPSRWSVGGGDSGSVGPFRQHFNLSAFEKRFVQRLSRVHALGLGKLDVSET